MIDMFGRLWLQWTALVYHDYTRSAWSVAAGYGRLLQRELNGAEARTTAILAEQQKALISLGDVLQAMSECSRGETTTIGNLISRLERVHRGWLDVTRVGNLNVALPSDHLGFVLWMLISAQRPSIEGQKVTLQVDIADTGGCIVIAPGGTNGTQRIWKPMPETSWWFGDAIRILRTAGCVVEPYIDANDDQWYIRITWSSVR